MITFSKRRIAPPGSITNGVVVYVNITPEQKRYLARRGGGNVSLGARRVIDACLDGDVVLSAEEYAKWQIGAPAGNGGGQEGK
jgi:hypothetical protein